MSTSAALWEAGPLVLQQLSQQQHDNGTSSDSLLSRMCSMGHTRGCAWTPLSCPQRRPRWPRRAGAGRRPARCARWASATSTKVLTLIGLIDWCCMMMTYLDICVSQHIKLAPLCAQCGHDYVGTLKCLSCRRTVPSSTTDPNDGPALCEDCAAEVEAFAVSCFHLSLPLLLGSPTGCCRGCMQY